MDNHIEQQTGEIVYPSIVFRLKDAYCCVNSRDIATILQLPSYQPVPAAPAYITGIFPHRDAMVQMLDLRSVFGLPTQAQENKEFSQMLDNRKQDHITWVRTLDHALRTDEPFTLATDPHKCAFGKWYDHFHCDNDAVTHLLGQIEEPHRLLHHAAIEADECKRDCEKCGRAAVGKCRQDALKRARDEYMPAIVRMLDEAKDLFRDRVFRGMVLILSGEENLGLVVDEVISVEDLDAINGEQIFNSGFNHSEYLLHIKKSPKLSSAILEIDTDRLWELFHRT